jgi:hypothetical protein
MRQADAFRSTLNSENLSRILHHAYGWPSLPAKSRTQLAGMHCSPSACWRAAQRLRQWPSPTSRA